MLNVLMEINKSVMELRLETQEMIHSSEINKREIEKLGMRTEIIKLKREKREMEELATEYGKIINYMVDAVASDVKRKEILNTVIKKLGDIQ